MPVSHSSGWSRRRPGLLGTGLIALALWVQALAPLGALRMMLGAPADRPLGILCGHGPDRAAISPTVDRPGPAAPDCALCRLCRAGLAPPPVPGGPVPARRFRWQSVAWPIPPPIRIPFEARRAARPRAPPTTA